MNVYKMLVVNRLREYKRLISNMLLPIISLLVVLLWIVYQIFCGLLPELRNISEVNQKSFLMIQIIVIIYSLYSCIGNKKALIVLKPMTLLLFGENQKRKFIRIKYITSILKHMLISILLTACIGGLRFDFELFQIILILYSYLEITSLVRWEIYHKSRHELRKLLCFWGVASVSTFSACFMMEIGIVNFCVAIALYYHSFFLLSFNWVKYEDEMRFEEAILSAQNYNNIVLLNSYAKEKKLRKINGGKRMSSFSKKYPLLWKSALSIFRLNKAVILGGIAVFVITLGIYKIPYFWGFPFLEEKEIRYLLLLLGMMILYQLSLQSMMRQMDILIEKAEDGLFLPLRKSSILLQFTIIPSLIISAITILFGIVFHTEVQQVLMVMLGMEAITGFVFYLELVNREFLRRVYFIISIVIFGATILLT